MNVVHYQPHYRPLGLLGRLLQEENLNNLNSHEPEAITDWLPAVDIKEEEECYLLRADLPGVDSADIDVTMEDGILTISGHREAESEEKDASYSRFERISGSFLRRFTLPDTANGDEIEAHTRNGVLEVKIAKQAKLQPRKIQVKSA